MLSITCSNYSYVTNSLLNRRLQCEVVALLYKIKYHWFLLKDLYREYELLSYLSPGFPVCANKTLNLLILSILLSIIGYLKISMLRKKETSLYAVAVLSNHFQTLHSSRSDKSFKSVDSYHLFHDILYIIDTNPKVIRNIH